MPKVSKTRQAECRARLLELLQPGDRIFATVTHVSKSGMSRVIDFHIYRCDTDARNPQRLWLTPFMGDLLGESWGDRGIKRVGCGQDMAFDAVYTLGRILFPDGFECVGARCRSNDHSNGMPRILFPNVPRADQHHTDGGYAFDTER